MNMKESEHEDNIGDLMVNVENLKTDTIQAEAVLKMKGIWKRKGK